MGKDISIIEPKPYQIIQRRGFCPGFSHYNNPGGPRLGNAVVRVKGIWNIDTDVSCEARTVLLEEAFGKAMDWTPVKIELAEGGFSAEIELPAGGWYRLELRAKIENRVLFSTSVEPIGVGEIFIIAGQSYAENCNDKRYQVGDPQGRVTVYDHFCRCWKIAHDPQPIAKPDPSVKYQKDGPGTIWPHTMNLLLPLLRVPIGMINVAKGATSSRQWMPGEELFNCLADAGRVSSDFRYILWQQGESDVIEKTGSEEYERRILCIKKALENIWGFSRDWILAKSTFHPTVYIDPVKEGEIRQAVNNLCLIPGFLKGPDTDILGGIGVYRADFGASGHFTALGQENAGLLWFSSIWNYLNGSNI